MATIRFHNIVTQKGVGVRMNNSPDELIPQIGSRVLIRPSKDEWDGTQSYRVTDVVYTYCRDHSRVAEDLTLNAGIVTVQVEPIFFPPPVL